ncbi:MAG: M24 family metallopeptidase, partial [Alphaproteobacteria bacterium]
MDAYYFTAACIDSLRKNLPNARFKDATSLVNWVRVVKSKAEIRYMQQAARIMENMIKVTVAAMKPGARQCDVAAKILHAQTAGTKQYGGEYASIVPMLPTGKASIAPHLTWSDRKFRRGELTAIELAAVRNRYHVPLARSVFLGKAPARVLDLAKVQIEGLDAAIGAAKPGVTAEDVERAFRKVITRHGIEKESRIGYSTGLNYPPDWGEHTISLRAGDKTVLQENMTIHCVPALSVGNDGIETSETIQITAKGAKPFCNVPRKLFVKG